MFEQPSLNNVKSKKKIYSKERELKAREKQHFKRKLD